MGRGRRVLGRGPCPVDLYTHLLSTPGIEPAPHSETLPLWSGFFLLLAVKCERRVTV